MEDATRGVVNITVYSMTNNK